MRSKTFFDAYKKNKKFQQFYQEEKRLLTLAIEIADARKKKRLTQTQLAKKAGMPQSQIARIESGSHNVTIGTLNRVASALNLKLKVAG